MVKRFLVLGAISFIISCVIIGAFQIRTFDSWIGILLMLIVYSIFSTAGIIYANKEKATDKKRRPIIISVIVFYGIGIVALFFKKLFLV